MLGSIAESLVRRIERRPNFAIHGEVTAIVGLLVEIAGFERSLGIGDRCELVGRENRLVLSEVVGFRDGRALVMPF